MCLACGERCHPALSQCSKAQARKARHLPHQPLENEEEAGGGQTKDQAMRRRIGSLQNYGVTEEDRKRDEWVRVRPRNHWLVCWVVPQW